MIIHSNSCNIEVNVATTSPAKNFFTKYVMYSGIPLGV